ncbi:MAG TPA: DDE-type integrase/transposase/recombinase [Candidatus Enteromonas pullicola]|uniref:DDE-type integrase/transposase/recombinase n=1 Tax=Candidatus Alloenteromonas pullicola TaxID=2840784 RepID=A0A9D1S3G2_9FIRM|nr:DDE-type integrase/transposase/recombinase [Candidatus Enteromonas pullicola]
MEDRSGDGIQDKELYQRKHSGLNFRHFAERLDEEEGVMASYRSIYRILTEAGFRSPKGHRPKRAQAKHPSRPRRKGFGELLQIDVTIHNWLGDGLPKATLHGAIDDAAGAIMGPFLDKEETLRGYYEMAWRILLEYGIPEAFYGDNGTIFEHRELPERNKAIDRDAHISFKRVCRQLGIELTATSASQAWGTLQPRLASGLGVRVSRQ